MNSVDEACKVFLVLGVVVLVIGVVFAVLPAVRKSYERCFYADVPSRPPIFDIALTVLPFALIIMGGIIITIAIVTMVYWRNYSS